MAEDLVADTFERAFKARKKFDRRKASEKTWLYAIALNCLRDQMRRSGTRAAALQDVGASTGSAAPDSLGPALTRMDVMDALHELTSEERVAVALRFGAQMTVPEIAEITRQELTTAEGRVYRAIRKLREVLEPDDSA